MYMYKQPNTHCSHFLDCSKSISCLITVFLENQKCLDYFIVSFVLMDASPLIDNNVYCILHSSDTERYVIDILISNIA